MDLASRRAFLVLGLLSPPVMYWGGMLFFIPRNPSFYVSGQSPNWGNVASAFSIWVVLAWATFLLAFWLSRPSVSGAARRTPAPTAATGADEKREKRSFRTLLTQPANPFHGWAGVVVFFAVGALVFAYFELHFSGFFLYGLWELPDYFIVLIPYFSLAYLGRKWIPSWRVTVVLWIAWAVIWDTAVPGFVYVPNLTTWHEWMFSAVAARFVADGYL